MECQEAADLCGSSLPLGEEVEHNCTFLTCSASLLLSLQSKKKFERECKEAEKSQVTYERLDNDINATKSEVEKVGRRPSGVLRGFLWGPRHSVCSCSGQSSVLPADSHGRRE